MLTTLPALCRVSLISLAYFLCEKDGVEEIVWQRPPRDDPVTLMHLLTGVHSNRRLGGGGVDTERCRRQSIEVRSADQSAQSAEKKFRHHFSVSGWALVAPSCFALMYE